MSNENNGTQRKSTKELVSRMQTLRSFGMGWSQVAGVLKEEGFTTKTTGKPYGNKTLQTLFSIYRSKGKKKLALKAKAKQTQIKTQPAVISNTPTGVVKHATNSEYWSWQMQRCLDEALMWRAKLVEASTRAVTK